MCIYLLIALIRVVCYILSIMTKDHLINDLKRRKAKLGTWKAVADELKVTQQYVHDVKEYRREPGPTFLSAMGLERVVVYRKIDSSKAA